MPESDIIHLVGAISGTVMLLTVWANRHRVSPTLAIFGRWARWVFFAVAIAVLADIGGYEGHPLWVVALAGFLGWFLVESAYTWMAVNALSRSELPLFPRYEENTRGDEWPSQERFIRIRAWLRRNGFKRVQALYARIQDQVLMRVSVYESEDRKTRLSVLFFPSSRGSAAIAYSFHTQAEDGIRLVTDNIFLPFGGFYPEDWYVERRPWTQSLEKLHQRHAARCDAHGTAFTPFEGPPLNEFNQEQRHLEQLNRELGFLTNQETEEAEGRISSAGRFRVWWELWTLSYFGKSRRY